MGGTALLLLVTGLAFGALALSMNSLSVEFSDSKIHLKLPLYGREIALDDLVVDQAEIVSLKQNKPFRPRLRTNGIGFPGYAVGWHRLHNDEKALVAKTSSDQALYIPTENDYVLLLGLEDPETVLDHLQSH